MSEPDDPGSDAERWRFDTVPRWFGDKSSPGTPSGSACSEVADAVSIRPMIPIDLLLRAYEAGLFPMGMDDGEIGWFSPDPRGIIPLETFHVPRRLARIVRQGRFTISINRAFGDVIRACASPGPDRDGTWINPEIVQTYEGLHRLGLAHSVEASVDGRLVGGLYGVALRGAFFGESMFSRATDASKVALQVLVARLRERGYRLLDIQWVTPHLVQFGAVEISRREYMRRLAESLDVECGFGGEGGRE